MKGAIWRKSLWFQVVALLTLALLPLGAVAIYQTDNVEKQARRHAERALLGFTSNAARAEELTLERAAGAAQSIAALASSLPEDPGTCRQELARVMQSTPSYRFIGISVAGGAATCSVASDANRLTNWIDTVASALPTIEEAAVVNIRAASGSASVFLVSEPFHRQGVFAGFVSIAVPHTNLEDPESIADDLGQVAMLLFDSQGVILKRRNNTAFDNDELPQGMPLLSLLSSRPAAFSAPNVRGEPRIYTLTPVLGSPTNVLGIWRQSDSLSRSFGSFIQPAVFPILMWLASLAVALLSVYLLVLRHLSRIRENMDLFSKNRSVAFDEADHVMPMEIKALSSNFKRMADDIIREEANLEDNLREKNVLLKEVHHRVKNNLQLIASIMNMQIRAAKHKETKTVLSRVQDRVLSLATIHRDLYQSHHGGRVDAGNLINEIVQKTLEMGPDAKDRAEVEVRIAPILLYPDQAVPLSLLVAEAMTNAMKHLGPSRDGTAALIVRLEQANKMCTLHISNATGGKGAGDSTGLGTELMNAFAIQLGGKMTSKEANGRYTFEVTFEPADFMPDTPDF